MGREIYDYEDRRRLRQNDLNDHTNRAHAHGGKRTMKIAEKFNALKAKIEADRLKEMCECNARTGFNSDPANVMQIHGQSSINVTIKPGKKYVKVDVGTSGKYMVDLDGNIYGIKAYGVIHKGHQYGTLDTIDAYYWGDYTARKIA